MEKSRKKKLMKCTLILTALTAMLLMSVCFSYADDMSFDVTHDEEKCGQPMTFTIENATGGSGSYQYEMQCVYRYDSASDTFKYVTDPSYAGGLMNQPVKQTNGYQDSNTFSFTFYASGTYRVYFLMRDTESKQYTVNPTVVELSIIDDNYPTVETVVQNVAEKCAEAGCSTDYEKALWLHDWLLDNCTYDYSYMLYCGAEGAMCRGVGTCEAYHAAYVMLLKEMGIETGRATGNGHVWTMAKLDDDWYQIDVTWDDNGYSMTSSYESHLYFAITDDIMKLVHSGHTADSNKPCTTLKDNYLIQTGKIKDWSDPLKQQIQTRLDAGEKEFELEASASYYQEVLYNVAAYQLETESWISNGKEYDLEAQWAEGIMTCKLTTEPDLSPRVSPEQAIENLLGESDFLRIAGNDRYETSRKSADAFLKASGLEKFDNVVVASGTGFPDALSGGYLAKVKNAPLILVGSNNERDVATYIKNNLREDGRVYILGGTPSVSASFESMMEELGLNSKRLGGADRYETNLLILKEAGNEFTEIQVCAGFAFPDSLSASSTGRPILLTDGNDLRADQVEYLESIKASTDFYIIGGYPSVSKGIEKRVGEILSGKHERLGGANRYETSRLVAEHFFPDGSEVVVLASARAFPDGLSGSALARVLGAPIVLTNTDSTGEARKYTESAWSIRAVALGGPEHISDGAAHRILGISVSAQIAGKLLEKPVSCDNDSKAPAARTVYTFDADNCSKVMSITAAYNREDIPQGMAYTGTQYYILYGNTTQKIGTYDIDGRRAATVKFEEDIGKPNAITWNPKTGLCYILKGQHNGAYTWNPLTNKIGHVDMPYSSSGIGYDRVTEMIYATSATCIREYSSDGKFKHKKSFQKCAHNDTSSIQDCCAYGGIIVHGVTGSESQKINYVDFYRAEDEMYLGSIKITLGEIESMIVDEDGYLQLLIYTSGKKDYITKTELNMNDLI